MESWVSTFRSKGRATCSSDDVPPTRMDDALSSTGKESDLTVFPVTKMLPPTIRNAGSSTVSGLPGAMLKEPVITSISASASRSA